MSSSVFVKRISCSSPLPLHSIDAANYVIVPSGYLVLVLVSFSCQMVHQSIMDDRRLGKKKKKKYYVVELYYRTDPRGLSRSEFELLPL